MVAHTVVADRVFIVRHGRTAWSATGRHTGVSDIPLDPVGEAEARSLAPLLAGHRFAVVLTSPRQRAVASCRLAGFGDAAEVCDDLAEWDYGRYDGLTRDQIHATDPGWTVWRDGGPGGESPAQVSARADRVVERLHRVDGDALLFAHGHILRVLTARWVGADAAFGRAVYLATATVSVLGWERDDPVIRRWNVGPGEP